MRPKEVEVEGPPFAGYRRCEDTAHLSLSDAAASWQWATQQQLISPPKSWPILESHMHTHTHTHALATAVDIMVPNQTTCVCVCVCAHVCVCAASHNNNGLTTLKMCVKCARATRIVPAFNGFIETPHLPSHAQSNNGSMIRSPSLVWPRAQPL